MRYSQFKNLNSKAKAEYLATINLDQPIVDILAFAFMPDHFHFLLRQTGEKGIVISVSNFQNAFAKYYNRKNYRDGSMFKSPFSAKIIENEEQLIHISRYIHINPATSLIVEPLDLLNYKKTSLPYYVNATKDTVVNTDFLLKMFGSTKAYQKFVLNQIDYQRKLHLIKKLTIE